MSNSALAVALLILSLPFGAPSQPALAQQASGNLILAFDDNIYGDEDDDSDDYDDRSDDERDGDDDSAYGPDDDGWDVEEYERTINA